MAITTPWPVLEAQVHALLNSLAAGTVAAAETAYAALPKVNDTDIDDAAFPKTFVRRIILQAHQQVVAWVCSTDGHPRRLPFRSVVTLAHLAALPTSISVFGAVYDAVTGRKLTKLSDPAQITDIVADEGARNGVSLFYWAENGNTFFTTLSGNASVEVFRFDNPAPTDASLSALFDAITDLIYLDDEFANPIVCYAVGVLAAKSASYTEQAGLFLSLAEKTLDSLGVKTSPNDFAVSTAKAA